MDHLFHSVNKSLALSHDLRHLTHISKPFFPGHIYCKVQLVYTAVVAILGKVTVRHGRASIQPFHFLSYV